MAMASGLPAFSHGKIGVLLRYRRGIINDKAFWEEKNFRQIATNKQKIHFIDLSGTVFKVFGRICVKSFSSGCRLDEKRKKSGGKFNLFFAEIDVVWK